MTRARWMMLSMTGAISMTGCAQILGYDQLDPAAAPVRDSGATFDATSSDVTSDAPADAVIDASAPNARWPTRPAGEATPSGKGKTLKLEVEQFHIGSLTRLGVASSKAWREWGFDLDEQCTDEASASAGTTICKPAKGAPPSSLVDGDGCRDNNFGSQLVTKVINVFAGDFETKGNTLLRTGSGTWVFVLEDVDDGPDDPYAPGSIYLALPFDDGAPNPTFDGNDVRIIDARSVTGGDASKPVQRFAKGYVRDHVWVSGELAPVTVLFPNGKQPVAPVQMELAVVTMTLSDDHTTAKNGNIGGALSVGGLLEFVRPIAEGGGVCSSSPIFATLANNVAQYPDLVLGAKTLQDPSVTCDGISLGVGFDLAPAQIPGTVQAPTLVPSKCDAGVD